MAELISEIKFGTDGWRGIISDTFTLKNLKIVSQSVADYLGVNKKVAVGYDTRFMSDRFAQAAAQVLAANGIDVLLSDRFVPTPALSFAVKTKNLDLGVMITASHNPSEYNGFKIKMPSGGAAGLEVTQEIERNLGKTPVKEGSGAQRIKKVNFISDYIRFIRSYVDIKRLKEKKFKVLVDSMYGSGDSFIADVLKGTNIKIEFLHNSFNPSFGAVRPEPLEQNLKELKEKVKKGRFDIGIALDGDADRIAAVASDGTFIHPQKILGLLALHLNQDRRWSGGIVKTIVGTTMIDKIADFLKIKLFETPVGFKYISSLMGTEDVLTGGEEAGGMGVKGYIPERDGTVAGLLLLEMMAYRKKNILKILNEMEAQFGRYYYLRDDIHTHKEAKPKKEDFPKELLGKEIVQVKDYDGIKLICSDESWLMFRASGTEPIVRVYTEAKSLARSKKLLEFGRDFILRELIQTH